MHPPPPLLTASGIGKTFAGRRAVHDLSFQLQPGEIFSLLGPNGAGKTTAVRMLIGVIRPDEGRITVSLEGATSTALPPRLSAYLPEDRGLYREIPVHARLFRATARPRERSSPLVVVAR